jgi:hypothetical protein
VPAHFGNMGHVGRNITAWSEPPEPVSSAPATLPRSCRVLITYGFWPNNGAESGLVVCFVALFPHLILVQPDSGNGRPYLQVEILS